MVPPVVYQIVSKSLAPSLQSNCFYWHPSTFASFQMDLMSLSLSMRAFECLPLQNFVVVVVVATSAFHLVQYPHKPPKSHTLKIPAIIPFVLPAFVNCSFIHVAKIHRLLLSLLLLLWFSSLEDGISYQENSMANRNWYPLRICHK